MAVKAAVLKFMPFRIGNLPFVVRLTGSLVTSEPRGPSSTHIAYFRALEAMVGIIRDDEQFFMEKEGQEQRSSCAAYTQQIIQHWGQQ